MKAKGLRDQFLDLMIQVRTTSAKILLGPAVCRTATSNLFLQWKRGAIIWYFIIKHKFNCSIVERISHVHVDKLM